MTPQETQQIKTYVDTLITPPSQTMSEFFATSEEQIKRMLEINENVWHDPTITPDAIAKLGPAPVCPPSDERNLYAVVLLSETGDALKTFERNWLAMQYVHGETGTWKWDGLVLSPKGVRPRPGAKPRPVGLRWAIVELGRAYQNRKVQDVRPFMDGKEQMGMGQELPLIGALHPKWATSMNGESIPYVDAPDLEVAPCAGGGFDCAPCLCWSAGDRRVGLGAGDVSGDGPKFGSGSVR